MATPELNVNSPVGDLMTANSYTRNDLIRATGLTADALSEIISGARHPRVYEIAYLARAFDVHPSVILPGIPDRYL